MSVTYSSRPKKPAREARRPAGPPASGRFRCCCSDRLSSSPRCCGHLHELHAAQPDPGRSDVGVLAGMDSAELLTAWNATPFGRFLVNSFIQTGIITVAQVLFSVLAGYAFAMFDFRFKNLLFYLVIGSLDGAVRARVHPELPAHQRPGLGQHLPGPHRALPGQRLRRVHDAAVLPQPSQGAVGGRAHRRRLELVLPVAVVVPLSKGAISAFTIFSFLGAWNQYLWPLIITNEEQHADHPNRHSLLPRQPGAGHRLGRHHGRTPSS